MNRVHPVRSQPHVLPQIEASGEIDSFDVVLLDPHGGDLEGVVVVKGDQQKLALLRTSEAFVRIVVGVQLVHARAGGVGGYSGAELPAILRLWDEQEDRLLG